MDDLGQACACQRRPRKGRFMNTWQEILQTRNATRNIETNVDVYANGDSTYAVAIPTAGGSQWEDLTAEQVDAKLIELGSNITTGWR